VATKLIDDDVTPSLLHQLFSDLFSQRCARGVVRSSEGAWHGSHTVSNRAVSRRLLERAAAGGESPVGESRAAVRTMREYTGTRDIPVEAGGTTRQG
jgi:hypothetical protein